MRTWRHVSLPGHSMYTHIRIWAEAINLVVPKAPGSRARGWCLHGTTSRRLIQSSYESERARDLQNALCLPLSLFLSRYRLESHEIYTHTYTHIQRNNDGHRSTRNGSRGTQKSARCVQEVERSVDFLPTNFLIASLNSSDRRLLYFEHQLGQPPWFKVVTLTT